MFRCTTIYVVCSDDSEPEAESAEVGTSDEGERDSAQVRLIYNHHPNTVSHLITFPPLHFLLIIIDCSAHSTCGVLCTVWRVCAATSTF